MKKRNKMRNYPFLMAVIISILCLTLLGLIGRNNIYSNYKCSSRQAPMLSAVFEGISAGEYPWKITGKYVNDTKQNPKMKLTKKSDKKPNKRINTKTSTKTSTKTKTKTNTNTNTNTNTKPDTKQDKKSDKTQVVYSPGKVVKKSTKRDATQAKQPENSTEIKFVKVSKSYFKDALFIGDSRTVGLSEYSGWKKSTYYADVGLTIYDVFDKKIVKMNGTKVTIAKALKRKHFKKIYIMLGINELGTGTTKTFISEYKKVVKRIKKLQPNAIIFVEGIMKVGKDKSDKDPIFNNKNITIKNNHLAKLADKKQVFYIDVNEAITDKSGSIPAKYTFDSIHLKAAYYRLWTDFLLKHGIK